MEVRIDPSTYEVRLAVDLRNNVRNLLHPGSNYWKLTIFIATLDIILLATLNIASDRAISVA